MGRERSTNGEDRNACRLLVGKPEAERPLGRPRHNWVHNIQMSFGEVGWGGVWSGSGYGPAESSYKCGNNFGYHKMMGTP
jgi:hypothetical protein